MMSIYTRNLEEIVDLINYMIYITPPASVSDLLSLEWKLKGKLLKN
jgi:hypothetical protein